MTLLLAMMVQFLNGKPYEQSGERLTEVPDNIPDDTTRVQLSFNHIQIVRQHAFSHLSLCVQLNLHENIIHDIQRDAFYGLESLEILILSYNRLKVKQREPFGFVSYEILLYKVWFKQLSSRTSFLLEDFGVGHLRIKVRRCPTPKYYCLHTGSLWK